MADNTLAPPMFRFMPWIQADWSRVARMVLLETLVTVDRAKRDVDTGAMRKRLKTALRSRRVPRDQARAMEAEVMRGTQLGHADPPANVRHFFGQFFPEVSQRLTDVDLITAIAFMGRTVRAKKTPEGQHKWPWLSGWMLRIGLHDVDARSLQTDWRAWRKARRLPE